MQCSANLLLKKILKKFLKKIAIEFTEEIPNGIADSKETFGGISTGITKKDIPNA